MYEVKFKTIHTKDEIELAMPVEYYEKLRAYCLDNKFTISAYIKMKLEECNYTMSEFYKGIESL